MDLLEVEYFVLVALEHSNIKHSQLTDSSNCPGTMYTGAVCAPCTNSLLPACAVSRVEGAVVLGAGTRGLVTDTEDQLQTNISC